MTLKKIYYPGNIYRVNQQFSESQPIAGSCNRHKDRSAPRWDMHYGLEFGLVCSGKEHRLFFDKSETDVAPGDVWFCGMWEPHGAQVVTAPCEVIVLKIWPPFLAQMHFPEAPDFYPLAPFIAPPARRPRTPDKLRKTMIEFGRRLKNIISSDTRHQAVELRLVFLEILLRIYESWPGAASWGRSAPSMEFSRINQAVQKVFESRNFISTSEAARLCGMNRHAFSVLFQSWMNIRFADFSARHRLHQATAQLRATPEPIKAIARQWGFVDESHFHRMFRKHFGFAPNEYRRQMSGRKFPNRN